MPEQYPLLLVYVVKVRELPPAIVRSPPEPEPAASVLLLAGVAPGCGK